MSTKLIVVPLLLSSMMFAGCAKEAAPEPKKPADASKEATKKPEEKPPAPAPEKK